MTCILLIEDNQNLAFGLRNNLEIEGYEVLVARDGERGLELLRGGARPGVDLVLLDLMLPGMDGLEVLKSLRRARSQVPVLILTARGDEATKVRGLRTGADDYVTKPFSLLELFARVEALLRRGVRRREAGPIDRFGAIEIDHSTRQVRCKDEIVRLTPKEYDLLVTLAAHANEAVARTDLMKEVWGYPSDVLTRTLDTHIGELRRKLESSPGSPRHIHTVRKFGYKLTILPQ